MLNLSSGLLSVLKEHIGNDRVYSTFQIKEGTAGIKVGAREWKQGFWSQALAEDFCSRGSL